MLQHLVADFLTFLEKRCQNAGKAELLTLVVITCIYLLYYYVTRPLNRLKMLGELGFKYSKENMTGLERAREITRLQELRKQGELPPVFPNGWYCIAESYALQKSEIKQVTVFGQLLSLIRSESGKAYLVDSYCPHLGANFSVGGKVVSDNCIQCPFHGWIFSAESGKCVKIPYDDGTIPAQAKVNTWPVCEVNKHIYVWYHSDGIEPEWEIPEIPEITSGEWTYGGRTEHEVLCHCQEIPENGADIAHLNYLHLAGPNEGNDVMSIKLNDLSPMISHVWSGSWTCGTGDEKHIGTMILDQYLTLKGKLRIPLTKSHLRAEQLGPGIVLMHFDFGILGKGCVLQHVTPEQPLLQRVRFNMYSTCSRWYCKFFLISEANQFERDVFIWNNKRYLKDPIIVRNDGPIKKHRRWYSQFYTENSPKLLPNGRLSNQAESVLDW